MDLYRRFEAAVKKNGFASVKHYEDSLVSDLPKQAQVRICRMIRNYIEHENITFVEASDQMILFIEKELIELDENETPVRKKMIPVKSAIRDTDLIVVAADFMLKKKAPLIPIFDKTDYAIGVISYADIVQCVAAGDFTKARKVSIIQQPHKFGFINEDMPMSQVRTLISEHNRVYLVLNDSRKVIGWVV